MWPSSEEAAGVGRLFRRRGKLEKGVQGLVLHTFDASLAPRAGARDDDLAEVCLRSERRVSGLICGDAPEGFPLRVDVSRCLNFFQGSDGPLPVNTPSH